MLAHHEVGPESPDDDLPDSHPCDDHRGSHDFIERAVHRGGWVTSTASVWHAGDEILLKKGKTALGTAGFLVSEGS